MYFTIILRSHVWREPVRCGDGYFRDRVCPAYRPHLSLRRRVSFTNAGIWTELIHAAVGTEIYILRAEHRSIVTISSNADAKNRRVVQSQLEHFVALLQGARRLESVSVDISVMEVEMHPKPPYHYPALASRLQPCMSGNRKFMLAMEQSKLSVEKEELGQFWKTLKGLRNVKQVQISGHISAVQAQQLRVMMEEQHHLPTD